jgi:hypothetical protein
MVQLFARFLPWPSPFASQSIMSADKPCGNEKLVRIRRLATSSLQQTHQSVQEQVHIPQTQFSSRSRDPSLLSRVHGVQDLNDDRSLNQRLLSPIADQLQFTLSLKLLTSKVCSSGGACNPNEAINPQTSPSLRSICIPSFSSLLPISLAAFWPFPPKR